MFVNSTSSKETHTLHSINKNFIHISSCPFPVSYLTLTFRTILQLPPPSRISFSPTGNSLHLLISKTKNNFVLCDQVFLAQWPNKNCFQSIFCLLVCLFTLNRYAIASTAIASKPVFLLVVQSNSSKHFVSVYRVFILQKVSKMKLWSG